MAKFETGLLSCIVCDSDLELFGKKGVILQTRCPCCGMTSNNLNENYLVENKVEVYYHSKAPASIPAPG